MTLVGYFNSLRELGGMKRLVDDDVRTRLRKMADRGLAKRTLYTPDSVKELTSRLGSAAIPETLDLLETVFDPVIWSREAARRRVGRASTRRPEAPPARRAARHEHDLGRGGRAAAGADGRAAVSRRRRRSTSRRPAVSGVSIPGLVCTVFNWARPRDLSATTRPSSITTPRSTSTSRPCRSRRSRQGPIYRGLGGAAGVAGPSAGASSSTRTTRRCGWRPTATPPVRHGGHRLRSCGGPKLVGDVEVAEKVRQQLKQKMDHWQKRAQRTVRGQSARLRDEEGRRDDRAAPQAEHRAVGRVHLPQLAAGCRADRRS